MSTPYSGPNKPTILSTSWKIVGTLHHMTADLGSPQCHAGPCIMRLSGLKMYPLRALISLHPDVPASFCCLCSFVPHWMPATHIGSLPNTPLHFSPVFLWPTKSPLLRAITNSCSYLLLVRSMVMWEPSDFICPTASHWKRRSTLPFPSCFLYNSKCSARQWLSLPPAFTLVSCSAYSNLKVESICSSEASVDFQRTTWRYIPSYIFIITAVRTTDLTWKVIRVSSAV
jgi:hypothetical protein